MMLNREIRTGASSSPPNNFFKKACRIITLSTASTMPVPISNHLKRSASSPAQYNNPNFLRLDSTGEVCNTPRDNTMYKGIGNNQRQCTYVPHESIFTSPTCSKLSSTYSLDSVLNTSSTAFPTSGSSLFQQLSMDKKIPLVCLGPLSAPSPAPKPSFVSQTGMMHKAPSIFTSAKSSEILSCTSVFSSPKTTSATCTSNTKSLPSCDPQVNRTIFPSEPVQASIMSHSSKKHSAKSPEEEKKTAQKSKDSSTSPKSSTKSPEEQKELKDPSTSAKSSDSCHFHLEMHVSPPTMEVKHKTTSMNSSSEKALPTMTDHLNVQVQFMGTQIPPTPGSNRKKKSRPSAKKRRRTQQKRDSCQSTPVNSTTTTPNVQKRSKKCHSSKAEVSSPKVQSPQSFQVTFLNMSPQHSPSNEKLWIPKESPSHHACSKLAFVITARDLDSGTDTATDSDWDEDEDDDIENDVVHDSHKDEQDNLWEAFSNQGLCNNPLSFSFTCNISSPPKQQQETETESELSKSPVDTDIDSVAHAVTEANKRWNELYGDIKPKTSEASEVHFPVATSALQEVHHMRQWDFAYRAARKGPWEQYVRDTERFQKRISNIETAIKHVFHEDHRRKIYDTYFNPEPSDAVLAQ